MGQTGVFRSLRHRNYRFWAGGALVSNVGTGMQRTAQDWLVLAILTHGSASAVGTVVALQFAPLFLLLPWTGSAADRFDGRKLLAVTQASMGGLSLVLGLLTIMGGVRLWHVDLLAFLFGCAAAFDAPVRQIFVSRLVGDDDLHNAVSLNSISFNLGTLVGPAASGLMIGAVGAGWAFILNGCSFLAVLASLSLLCPGELRPAARTRSGGGGFVEGLRYVAYRPDLIAILTMLFLVGTFALNFPIFISTMAVRVFHADAIGFGALSSALGLGTLAGTVWSAGRGRLTVSTLCWSVALLGVAFITAALSPSYWWFALSLVVVGAACLTFVNGTNAAMQLSTEPAMRGRVMALRVGIALGGAPLGAPIVGWVADHAGPRWALAIGAGSAALAAVVGVAALVRTTGTAGSTPASNQPA